MFVICCAVVRHHDIPVVIVLYSFLYFFVNFVIIVMDICVFGRVPLGDGLLWFRLSCQLLVLVHLKVGRNPMNVLARFVSGISYIVMKDSLPDVANPEGTCSATRVDSSNADEMSTHPCFSSCVVCSWNSWQTLVTLHVCPGCSTCWPFSLRRSVDVDQCIVSFLVPLISSCYSFVVQYKKTFLVW